MSLCKEARLFASFRFYSWLLVGGWTACVTGSLLWNLNEQADHRLQVARRTAQITFENDVLYRRWSSNQGGVYVRVSPDTPPNPYLKVPERDVTTTSGLSLTLVNPAYMARQVNAMAGAGGSRGHLTSLKPIRPENEPDAWEAAALRQFEQGVPEVSSVEAMADGETLRLMRPFVTERGCLKCHASQGYKEGDIRGGISVSVPMAPLRAIEESATNNLALAHVGLWMVGLAGIGVFRRRLGKEIFVREQSEEALRKSREDLDRAQAVGQIGSWRLDIGRNVLTWSDENYRIFGLPKGSPLTYETFLDTIHPDDRRYVDTRWKAGMAGEPYDIEHRIVADGHVKWVREKAYLEFDEAGKLLGGFGITQDITERKRAEEALRQAKEKLEHRVQERTAELHARAEQLSRLASELTLAEARERQRLAKVLHDHLQQLLVAAKFNATVIRAKAVSKAVQQTAEQLAETLNEAIRASRSLTAELSPPILHEKGLAAGLEWLARHKREKHGLTVEVEADPAAEPQAEQVRLFLFEAVRELLLNTAKHAQTESARVSMRLLETGEVEVTVTDDGVGFDQARMEADAATTGGFGLFSIRERLDYMGGRMTVESAPGRGSRFTLVAPARPAPAPLDAPPPAAKAPQAAAAQATATDAAPQPPARGKIRVLLADDHPIVRQGLARLLHEQPDIEVVGEAADGHEAVQLARQLRPEVILMDVTMPRTNGIDATRQIVSELPAIRIIGLSMHAEADMAAAMRKAGVAAYLTKGGPTEDLIAAIRAQRP